MKKKVLVVEDEKNFREILKMLIESWEHCEVGTARDGQEAASIIQKDPGIDLVITDLRMPKTNGIELIKWIRQKNQKIKIILLSGEDMRLVAPVAEAAGADKVLSKPFNSQDFQRTVRRFLV